MGRESRVTTRGIVYFIDGREVTREEWDATWRVPPPDYAKGECPGIRPDIHDWSTENKGRGRRISQLAKSFADHGDHCYARNQNEAVDKAKKLGFTKVERTR